MNQIFKTSYLLFIFSFLLFMTGCNHQRKSNSLAMGTPTDTLYAFGIANAVQTPVPVKIGQPDSISDYDLEDHLFGKFYGDRAGYYIIKNPGNKIYGHKVNSITLYYLDGKLYKTKYDVDDNLVNDLINLYPQFHIRGFDAINRYILSTKGIYYRKKKRWYLNDSLSNYDINWKIGSNNMRLRINKNNEDEPYQYIVKNRHYEEALLRIESSD